MSNDRISAHLDALRTSQDQLPIPAERDTDEAIRSSILALQADPALLENLGNQLDTRYQQTQNPNDLEAALQCYHLATTTTGHVNYEAYLDHLVKSLNFRFGNNSNAQDHPKSPTSDVDEAVQLEFLALQAAVNPALSQNLGMQQDGQHQQARNPHDLDAAVQCCQLATKATYIDYAAHLNRLVGLFDSRFQTSDGQLSPRLDTLESSSHAQGQPTTPMSDFIDKEFRLGFQALRVVIDPALLESLWIQLHKRFEKIQDIEDLNSAIEYSRLATKMNPYDHPDRKLHLKSLAELLECRFQFTGFLPDLDISIQITYAILLATNHTSDELISYWLDLGESFGRRFGVIGNIVDVNEAIGYLILAARETTEDSPFFVNVLVELAFNLNLRYDTLKDPKDLESAISLRQRVFQAPVDQDEVWLDCLRDLGNDLEARYKNIEQLSDLHDAISLARLVLTKMEIIGPNYYLLGDCFYGLGTKLGLLYEKTKMIDDLDEAIACSRKGVGATEPIEVYHHLEHLLILRYKETHQIKDSEEAARWAEEAAKREKVV